MKNIKLLLLSLSSVFLLNSCVALGIGAASYLTLLSFCFENKCKIYPKSKMSDYEGVLDYFEKNKGKEEEYLEDLKQREKEKIQVDGAVYINVPKGFKLKEYKEYKEYKSWYLLDDEKGIGSSVTVYMYINGGENKENSYKQKYEGNFTDKNNYIISKDGNMRVIGNKSIPRFRYVIKKLSDNVYAVVRIYDREKIDSITSYILESL